MLLHKSDIQLLSCLKDGAIVLASCGRGNVLGSTPRGSEHVVNEGEEGVRADSNALQLLQPRGALFACEGLGHLTLFEVGFKVVAFDAGVWDETGAEEVDGVGLGGPLGALLPLEVKSPLVEAHPPVVGFVASKARAVNASCARLEHGLQMLMIKDLHCCPAPRPMIWPLSA
jgi:hypothetical protein